jgi:ribonuclease HI
MASYTCGACGREFTLPEAVRAKYPNWTPKQCMECRDKPREGETRPAAKNSRARGNSVTRTQNLTTTEVLRRFEGGPETGIFTDGSCQGNPGPGGWGAVHVRDGVVIEERHGDAPNTTNNRMELTAMINGLEMAPSDLPVTVYSDSQLVVNTLTRWAKGWESRGWKRKEGEVKNLDLVQRAWTLVQERPLARMEWIRAHDGSLWNEYADALSTAYLRSEV